MIPPGFVDKSTALDRKQTGSSKINLFKTKV